MVHDPFLLPAYGVGKEFGRRMIDDLSEALKTGDPKKIEQTMEKIENIFKKTDTLLFLKDAEKAYR